jgi:hypothetical protein
MPVPKTMEECQQRAHAAATEAVKRWEQRDHSGHQLNGCAESEYQDVYSDELRELMGDSFGNGIDRCASELVRLSSRLRFETDAPSTLGIAVAANIEIADKRFDNKTPDLALKDIVASLVRSFGTDKVRAAINPSE